MADLFDSVFLAEGVLTAALSGIGAYVILGFSGSDSFSIGLLAVFGKALAEWISRCLISTHFSSTAYNIQPRPMYNSANNPGMTSPL